MIKKITFLFRWCRENLSYNYK